MPFQLEKNPKNYAHFQLYLIQIIRNTDSPLKELSGYTDHAPCTPQNTHPRKNLAYKKSSEKVCATFALSIITRQNSPI